MQYAAETGTSMAFRLGLAVVRPPHAASEAGGHLQAVHRVRHYGGTPAQVQVADAARAHFTLLHDLACSPATGSPSTYLQILMCRRVDLCKVDVERSELSVLRGIADEDWPLIKQVCKSRMVNLAL